MIKSSSAGNLYFFFKIFSHADKSKPVGLNGFSSVPLSGSSSPLRYFAIFSNSNLTEVNSILILFPTIILLSGKLYTLPHPTKFKILFISKSFPYMPKIYFPNPEANNLCKYISLLNFS